MSDLPNVAVVSDVHSSLLNWLAERAEVHYRPDAVQADLSTEPITTARALVLRSNVRIGPAELKHLTALQLVVRAGSGTDNLDLEALRRRGVEVALVGGGASAAAVAELAVQSSLAVLRRVPLAAAALLSGRWEKNSHVGRELTGSRVAVWGAGPIGRAVAGLVGAFGAEVAFLDHRGAPAPTLPLREICQYADVHFIALPLRAQTRHIVGPDVLELMAPRRPVLVNVGRWDLLDMAAVLAALDRGGLWGVAVDPVEREHVAALPGLLADVPRNLQLTPHLGAMTEAVRRRVAERAVEALEANWKIVDG